MTVGQKWPSRAMGDIYSLLTQGSSELAGDLGLEGSATSPTWRTDTTVLAKAGLAGPTPASVSPAHPKGLGQLEPIFLYPQVGLPVAGGKKSKQQAGTGPCGSPPPESCHIWDTSWGSGHTGDARGCRLQTAPPAGAGAGCRGACDTARNPRARHLLPACGQRGLRKLTRIHSSGGNWTRATVEAYSCLGLKMDSPSAEKALGSRRRCRAPVSCGEPCRHPDLGGKASLRPAPPLGRTAGVSGVILSRPPRLS